MSTASLPSIGACLSLTRAISRATSDEDIYAASLDTLTDTLEASRAAVLLFDADGVMRFTAWRGLSAEYRAAVEGHSPWTPDHPDPQTIVVADVTKDQSLDKYRSASAAEGIGALAFIPLVSAGRVIGKFMLYFDTPRVMHEDERQLAEVIAAQVAFALARTRAEANLRISDQLKDQFLATLSHELRTPLNAILGWTEVLERDISSPERVRHAIEVLKRNARLQAQLIEDILDVSRIITGKLTIETQPLNLAAVVDGALSTLLPLAAVKQIQVTCDIPDRLPTIEGDPRRLQQVLNNVIANAIKFTPERGTVRVSCAIDDGTLSIAITDSGAGITPELLPYIFERFRQGDSRSTRRHGGLGLGLAIARHLVERHDGSIEARSDGAGLGTTFTIRLPIPVHAAPLDIPRGSAGPIALDLSGCNVLVVDDQEDSRELLVRLLHDHGARVLQCSSAHTALTALSGSRFDLMIADIAMPEVDGYELIERVRQLHDGHGTLPAIAVTAYARTQDRARAMAAGYDGYCPKPLDAAEFMSVIARLLAARPHTSPTTS